MSTVGHYEFEGTADSVSDKRRPEASILLMESEQLLERLRKTSQGFEMVLQRLLGSTATPMEMEPDTDNRPPSWLSEMHGQISSMHRVQSLLDAQLRRLNDFMGEG